jgi:hypothetical protein
MKLISYGEILTCKECGKTQGHRYKNMLAGRKAIEREFGWDTDKMICDKCIKDLEV